ncbi:enoyl-CoA hydratase/isomerase family protein [Gordonia insulae]|uniref:2,3-dehydroadipyl-CoA hydratase n=1 Tax=Gordonia insulae TaxID=2420509 RepID=A0A3G8JK33_9ACTN|nr:enoyl-CoA hydratase/isomerase family protein [Gordonia insulae]AZG45353.1 2,3-dehydroadipyl-CoA hydratase [Gordonia insulae]
MIVPAPFIAAPFVADVCDDALWDRLAWSPDKHSGHVRIGFTTGAAPATGWPAVGDRCDVVYGPAEIENTHPAIVGADDPESAAHELADHVARNPQSATILAGVLRTGTEVSVRQALDVESWAYSTLLGGTEFAAWLARRGPRPLPPTSAAAPVLVDRDGTRLTITLNRPERRNAFGAALRDAMVAALDVAVLDDSLTEVHLRGAGPAFCAGGDLDEFGTTPDPVIAHFVRTAGGAGVRLAEIADRTTAFLHGACVGAGIELPGLAGRIVVDPRVAIRLPEVGMGLIPGAGGTVGIPRRIGRWRTFHLATSGTSIGAQTALAWGLADEVADVAPA